MTLELRGDVRKQLQEGAQAEGAASASPSVGRGLEEGKDGHSGPQQHEEGWAEAGADEEGEEGQGSRQMRSVNFFCCGKIHINSNAPLEPFCVCVFVSF